MTKGICAPNSDMKNPCDEGKPTSSLTGSILNVTVRMNPSRIPSIAISCWSAIVIYNIINELITHLHNNKLQLRSTRDRNQHCYPFVRTCKQTSWYEPCIVIIGRIILVFGVTAPLTNGLLWLRSCYPCCKISTRRPTDQPAIPGNSAKIQEEYRISRHSNTRQQA